SCGPRRGAAADVPSPDGTGLRPLMADRNGPTTSQAPSQPLSEGAMRTSVATHGGGGALVLGALVVAGTPCAVARASGAAAVAIATSDAPPTSHGHWPIGSLAFDSCSSAREPLRECPGLVLEHHFHLARVEDAGDDPIAELR